MLYRALAQSHAQWVRERSAFPFFDKCSTSVVLHGIITWNSTHTRQKLSACVSFVTITFHFPVQCAQEQWRRAANNEPSSANTYRRSGLAQEQHRPVYCWCSVVGKPWKCTMRDMVIKDAPAQVANVWTPKRKLWLSFTVSVVLARTYFYLCNRNVVTMVMNCKT